MASITKKMTAQQIQELKDSLAAQIIKESQPDYTYYQIKTKDQTITAYTSGKVVFQGKNIEAVQTQTRNETFPQAGSDEVGTGDYFGPVVVCAAIVNEKDVETIRSLGVDDSKTMTDEKIRQVAPTLQSCCPHSILIVDNEKYNEIHKTHNLNAMKAKLHNQAYINLMNKGVSLPEFKVIDQFAPAKTYFSYIQYEPQIVKDLHFETKAEHKYLAVASASVLARYAFLKHWDKMEQEYDFSFPKGAGTTVDEAAQEFVNQYGMDELNKVAKVHFKNTEKLQG